MKFTVETVMKIHHGEKEGDVLAFLTGQVTITKKIRKGTRSFEGCAGRYEVNV